MSSSRKRREYYFTVHKYLLWYYTYHLTFIPTNPTDRNKGNIRRCFTRGCTFIDLLRRNQYS